MTKGLSPFYLRLLLLMGSMGGLLFAFSSSLAFLWARWQTDEYSHGILIPFIALWLIVHQLAEAKPVLRSSFWGLALLGFGALLMVVGTHAAFDVAGALGLFFSLVGLFVSFYGIAAFKVVWPSFIYLLFAIPLPRGMEADLSQSLQLLASDWGVRVLQMGGVSVFQEGNIIDLGSYKLQVVEACDGLRYLFPLMSFGFLVALLLKDKLWKRAVTFLATLPLAVGLNTLRISFVGFTVDLWGVEAAEGVLHSFEGWSVFVLCLLGLLLLVRVLLFIKPAGSFRFSWLALPDSLFLKHEGNLRAPIVVMAFCWLFVVMLPFVSTPRDSGVSLSQPLANFPRQLGLWQGRSGQIDQGTSKALAASDYLTVDFVNLSDQRAPVSFYIAYYAQQQSGVMPHSPALCLPGGGWQIERRSTDDVKTADGALIPVTRLLLKQGDKTQLISYWFEERGRHLTSSAEAKIYLLWDSLMLGRSDGALVRLGTKVNEGESIKEAEDRIDDLLSLAYPYVIQFIPGAF